MARQRRRSMSSVERPISSQDLQSEFHRQEPRMRRSLSALEQICDETRTRKEEDPWKAGLAALGAGAAAVVLAPPTGGLSLVVGGAAAGAAAGAAGVVLYDRITDRRALDEVKQVMKEFCDAAELLKNMEDERRKMLNNLDHERRGSLNILYTADSTLQRLLEVTQQCRRILDELEVVKIRKRSFTI